ncbi:putative sucrose transporter [Colletotrichum sublineola]|uniref:Putative sucrose transporter n=1 Tax=Colletotrichum sublineola TaxID=1173701 RepID=A0A066XYP3_COLSU|nr:putative sucrose transporter [Colletotrichum sublineola]
MNSFEKDSTSDVPLYELDKTISPSSSGYEPVRQTAAHMRLAEEHPSISMWCIVAYAIPSMPIDFYFTMFTVYLVVNGVSAWQRTHQADVTCQSLQPYLMTNLGFTAFQVSLVLLTGPFSGLTASPVFGILSDRSGRRFIFFAVGSAAMAACQLVLGWSRELVGGNLVAARWLSIVAVFIGCISVRACIVGCRLLSMDNVPPHQQPVMNLMSGLMSSVGAMGTLVAGFVNPSFRLITLICTIGILLSIFPIWAVRRSQCHKPLVEKQSGGFDASILSVPRDMWNARTSLPPKICRTCKVQVLCQYAWFSVGHYSSKYLADSYVVTRGAKSEAAPPDLVMQAGVRVLLIAQLGGFVLQMTIARLWDPSLAPGRALRRLMNGDMVALRRIWALGLLTLGVSAMGAIFLRTSFVAASICIASIKYVAPISGFVPLAIISYEAALVQTEKGTGPSQMSSGMFFSYYEMSITIGQGLSAVGNALINFGMENISTHIDNPTAWLFPPTVVGAIIAALLC